MNIEKKIEEIRKSPEHIRERYVWIAVIICMLFVLGIWLVSFKTTFKSQEKENLQIKELIEKSKDSIDELPSIDDIKKNNFNTSK